MESRNPVFNNNEQFRRGGYATFDTRGTDVAGLEDLYASPSATSAQTGRMTLDDVVVRTGLLFAVLIATAGFTYGFVKPQGPFLVMGAALVGFVLAMVNSFTKTPKPALIIAYAAVEGVFVGGLSYWYAVYPIFGRVPGGDGLIAQAVLATLGVFAAMLVLFKAGIIRNSPKFSRILGIALIGYLVFAVMNLLLSAFHVGGYQNVYTSGGILPVLISGFAVVLAALFLVLDFDQVEQGIRNGLPRVYSWTAAFGLVVTLVWLYVEMLRLLAILRGDD